MHPDHQAGGKARPEIGPQQRSCGLPRELAPADVAAVEAVGEVDLVDRAIGARAGVGERVGDGGDGEHAAAVGDQAHRPSAVPAWKTVTPSTCSAASIARIAPPLAGVPG